MGTRHGPTVCALSTLRAHNESVLFEDFRENAMRESLAVWAHIVAETAQQTPRPQLLLVINKMDLFQQRWRLFPRYFPEFDGDEMNKIAVLRAIKILYLDIARQHSIFDVHCATTKLTDTMEMTSIDVEETKDILMAHRIDGEHGLPLHKDIVDEIMAFAVGDCFWSHKWLHPMWRQKMGPRSAAESHRIPAPPQQCDHVNHPHDFQAIRQRKRKHCRFGTKSLSRRLSTFSSLFQSADGALSEMTFGMFTTSICC